MKLLSPVCKGHEPFPEPIAGDVFGSQNESMQSALIIFATKEGQTQKVAVRILEHLENAGITGHLVNAADSTALKQIDLGSYDLLVFGASMHAGGLEREIVQFINANTSQIESKANSFFLVLLSAATIDPKLKSESLADARQKMHRQLMMKFDDMEMIAGALAYSKYSLPMKWRMRRIASKAGEGTDISRDYEYTDWTQVERYAERLVGMCVK